MNYSLCSDLVKMLLSEYNTQRFMSGFWNHRLPYASLRICLVCFTYLLVMTAGSISAQEWEPVGPDDLNQALGSFGKFINGAVDQEGNYYVTFVDNALGRKATVRKYDGERWTNVGDEAISIGQTEFTDIALSPGGVPYIVYVDGGTGWKTVVKKFNGTGWETVGPEGISVGAAQYASIAVTGEGAPIVAYVDFGLGSRAIVKQWNGASWVTVGNSVISIGKAQYTEIALSSAGKPYVTFNDMGNGTKIAVRTFNGETWDYLGGTGFSVGPAFDTNICLDNQGIPYVAYADNSAGNNVTVQKFVSGAWVYVGDPGFTLNTSGYIDLDISDSDTPYVSFKDQNVANKISVMRFVNSKWEYLGKAGFSIGSIEYTNIIALTDNIIYVAYSDNGAGYQVIVKKFDGSGWGSSGEEGFSEGEAWNLQIGSYNSGSGGPVALYIERDQNLDNRLTMKHFVGDKWMEVGTRGFSDKSPVYASIDFDGNNTPYVAYRYGPYNHRPAIMKFGGAGWTTVGGDQLDTMATTALQIKLARNNGLYMVHTDSLHDYKAFVRKYNGASWELVGGGAVTEGSGGAVQMDIAGDNTVYVFYSDATKNYTHTLKMFNGTNWEIVGEPGFYIGGLRNPQFKISERGTPYILGNNTYSSNHPVLLKFNGDEWEQVGIIPLEDGKGGGGEVFDIDQNDVPYVMKTEGAPLARALVRKFNGADWEVIGGGYCSAGSSADRSLSINRNNMIYAGYCPGMPFVKKLQGDPVAGCNLVVNELHQNLTCNNSADGSIDLIISGGTAPFQYSWSNGADTKDLDSLEAGEYSVTVADSKGCSKELGPIAITQPDSLINNITYSHVSCHGAADGNIQLAVSGGSTPYIYTWPDGLSGTNNSDLEPGSYTISVTDAALCFVTDTVVIEEPDPIDAELEGPFELMIDDEEPYFAAQGFKTYTWGAENAEIIAGNGSNSVVLKFAAAGSAKIMVEVENDQGCTNIDSLSIQVNQVTGLAFEHKGWKIYPNPFDRSILLEHTDFSKGNLNVNLLDLSGKIVASNILKDTKVIEFSTPDLPPGIYILRIHFGQGIHNRLLIKK